MAEPPEVRNQVISAKGRPLSKPTDDQHYEANDLISVSDHEFEHLMTKKYAVALASAAEWKTELGELVQSVYPGRQVTDDIVRAAGLSTRTSSCTWPRQTSQLSFVE